jgi:hypothetical protein
MKLELTRLLAPGPWVHMHVPFPSLMALTLMGYSDVRIKPPTTILS